MPPVENATPAAETVESKVARPIPLEDLSEAQHAKWLKTGDLPVKGAKEVKTFDEKDEPEVEKDATEEAEEPGAAAPKREKSAGKLSFAELRARVRELEAQLAKAPKAERAEIKEEIAEIQETASPKLDKLRAKPRSSDKNTDGSPKYKDWDEYEDDKDKWYEERSEHLVSQTLAKREEEQSIAAFNRTEEQYWTKRSDEAREQHEDFDDIALAKEGPGRHIGKGSVVDTWIMESELGAEILYYFGKNIPELLKYGKYTRTESARQLAKLEAKLSGEPEAKTPAPPEPKVTKAPKPASIVGGRGTAAVDEVTKALRDDPTKSEDAMRRFMDAENRANIRERLGPSR